jgi:hypothetical protein
MVVTFFFGGAFVFVAVGARFNGGQGGQIVEWWEAAGGTLRQRLEMG